MPQCRNFIYLVSQSVFFKTVQIHNDSDQPITKKNQKGTKYIKKKKITDKQNQKDQVAETKAKAF